MYKHFISLNNLCLLIRLPHFYTVKCNRHSLPIVLIFHSTCTNQDTKKGTCTYTIDPGICTCIIDPYQLRYTNMHYQPRPIKIQMYMYYWPRPIKTHVLSTHANQDTFCTWIIDQGQSRYKCTFTIDPGQYPKCNWHYKL